MIIAPDGDTPRERRHAGGIVHAAQSLVFQRRAAALAERLAELYQLANDEAYESESDESARSVMLDILFDAVADIDDLASKTSGPIVRTMLGA